MFVPEPNVPIWLCTSPVDMRKSYDGLVALASHQLAEDPLSGQLFVFVNRRKTHMKILYFDGSGYCLWCKRLEQGQFNFPASDELKRCLSWADLRLLLDGVAVKKMRQYKRYHHATAAANRYHSVP